MEIAKEKLLVYEATRWIGTKEIGFNKGQLVELFQKATDGVAQGEPWCLAFIQYCVLRVDESYKVLFPECKTKAAMRLTEHVLTLWNSMKEEQKCKPRPGALIFWRHGQTSSGHIGIVKEVLSENFVRTVEGNTGPGEGVVREGDGVFERKRSTLKEGDMRVVGFASPWL